MADQGALTQALTLMTARLGSALQRRGMQARALALHLHGDDGPWSAARVLEQPAADAVTLAPLVTGLLRAAGASGGVERLTLLVGELVPTRGEQLPLFASTTARREAGLSTLADLQARLGPGGLLRSSLLTPGTALAKERVQLTPWGSR